MDWRCFWAVWALGISAVLAQGIAAWVDGFLTQAQVSARGIANGWSFVEHGGMWADALLIAPLLGFVLGSWKVHYASRTGLVTFVAALFACIIFGYIYQENGVVAPEAHAHDGQTTVAGLIHGVFAIFALWTLCLVYLGATTPDVSLRPLVFISCALTPFCFLGVMKLSARWTFDRTAAIQVAAELALIWGATVFRFASK